MTISETPIKAIGPKFRHLSCAVAQAVDWLPADALTSYSAHTVIKYFRGRRSYGGAAVFCNQSHVPPALFRWELNIIPILWIADCRVLGEI
jgi:hypothetical protein